MQIDGTNSRTEELLVTGVEETKKPLSRIEAILRGEDIKPQSRIEKLLKEGGGSDVTIKQLSVTENGTYSEENTAYSPVIVNVPAPPIPDNAYLLNEVEGLPKDIATFNDGSNLPMPSLKVGIEPVQDLHGYDAPWVGGAGKNKFEADFTDTTVNGTAIHKLSDGRVTTSGVPTAAFDFVIGHLPLPAGSYILNGCPANGGKNKYRLQVTNYPVSENLGQDNGAGVSFTLDTDMEIAVRIQVYTGASASLEYKPMIRLSTVSDGTFAPYSNICPISGHTEANVSVCGVNVWDEEWELGYLDGGNGQPTTEPTSIRSKNFNGCVPNTNYYGSIPTESAGNAYYIYWYDADKNYISRDNIGNATKMSPSSAIYFKLACYHYGTTYNNDISINYPSTDTSYHAYNGQTYTIQFKDGDNPLTVCGGSLDVVSGVLTVTHAIKIYSGNSSEGWYADGTQSGSTYRMKATDVPNNIKLPQSNADAMSAISNQFIATPADDIFLGNEGIGIPTNGSYLTLYSSVYNTNDVSLWKTHLASNPMQLVYELATPLTIQLTLTQVKSLLGSNNVWADTGDIEELEYFSKEES